MVFVDVHFILLAVVHLNKVTLNNYFYQYNCIFFNVVLNFFSKLKITLKMFLFILKHNDWKIKNA